MMPPRSLEESLRLCDNQPVSEPRNGLIASVSKAFAALTAISSSSEPMSAKDLAQVMDMPLATTYHMLKTLTAEGAVVKAVDKTYRLGPRIGMLADAYLEDGEPIDALGGPLADLAARTGETAYISVWRQGEIEVAVTAEGSHAVRVAQLQRGAHGSAHARASGKLLLAHARPGLRRKYLAEHPLDRRTPNTIVDLDELESEFVRIRERGYAFDLGEFSDGVSCVAAPVFSQDRIIAAYTVSSPTNRFDQTRDQLVAVLLSVCQEATDLLSGRS